MEAAVRCLRDAVAPDETACCLVLVADDARVDGEEGMETFSSLLREHADAAAAGRAHARRTVLVAGARAPRRHRLDAHARPVSSPPGASRDGTALSVVDLTRDPHGWLVSINAGTKHAETKNASVRSRAAPRLGDVASVAAAIHDALGVDEAGEDERDERDDDVTVEGGGGDAGETPSRAQREKVLDTNPSRGRRSGLWGRAPRERARSIVALDCVAELVHASGAAKTLELIERVRADARVCGVVAYARGGGGILETEDASEASDAFSRAASRLRRAASCAVAVAPPRATTDALAEARRRRHGVETRSGGASDASSFLEETDALHFAAAKGEAENGAAARLSTSLSRPTGRFRVERRDVDARFQLPSATERTPRPSPPPVLEVSFSAETRGGGEDDAAANDPSRDAKDFSGDATARLSARRHSAEAEAEAQRARLERATPFKLGVSADESLARSRVVLPFEHQGGVAGGRAAGSDAALYERGDFLRYLPRDAGGESGVAGGGHGEAREIKAGGGAIVYVRDSEDDGSGSAPDSDEELDEDVDF